MPTRRDTDVYGRPLTSIEQVIEISGDDTSEVLVAASRVLRLIAGLHRVPARPAVELRVDARLRMVEGLYVYRRTRPNTPGYIGLRPGAAHPMMTTAHEIGHYLDNQVFDPLKSDFASEYPASEDFRDLLEAWKRSTPFQTLSRLLLRYGRRLLRSDRAYIAGLLRPRELWAATYAQWVAVRSGDSAMRTELEGEVRPTGHVAGVPFSTQWEAGEFVGIMACVEDLMSRKGLL